MTRPGAVVATAVLAGLGLAPATQALEVGMFARIPAPGTPEGLTVSPDGQRVYVSTYHPITGGTGAVPQVRAYRADGTLDDVIELTGIQRDGREGAGGMATDADGRLYVSAGPPIRIVRLDLSTKRQEDYTAPFPDLPRCGAEVTRSCSPARDDAGPLPASPVFGPDGELYVSDLQQAVIWRVPPGGGQPEVWFADGRFTSPFGIGKLALTADRRALLFGEVLHVDPASGVSGAGALWRVPIVGGQPGEPVRTYEAPAGTLVNGVAPAADGATWVSLANLENGVARIDAAGQRTAQAPADGLANSAQEVPFDDASTLAFLGDDLLVANSAYGTGDSAHWAVLRVRGAGPGVAPVRPLGTLPAPAAAPPATGEKPPRLRVAVAPRRVRAGVRTTLTVRARLGAAPASGTALAGGRRARLRGGRAVLRLRFTAAGRRRVCVRVPGGRRACAALEVRR